MKYKLIVFDIDGTLTTKGDEVPSATLKAIEELENKGYKIIIATGRERENLETIMNMTGIKNYVACNGHYVEFEDEVLYQYSYPKDVIDEIKLVCEEHGHNYAFSNGSGLYVSNFHLLKESHYEKMDRKTRYDQKIDDGIESAIILANDELGNEFQRVEESHILVPWGNGMYDIMKRDRSKAIGIDEIAKRLGIESEEVVSFGDGLNDLEMTEYAGLGIAMGNAKDELKKIADYITEHVEDDGVYKACKKHGLI